MPKNQSQATNDKSVSTDLFQRFEDLARKIANVPKDEIDAIDPLVQKKKKQKPAKKS